MIKKVSALILAVILLFSVAGCHQKGETVLVIDGYEIPSGLYLTAQMNAFEQFTNKVGEKLDSSYTVSDVKEYFKFTLDGVSAADWIYNTTLTALKKYVAVERRYAEAGLEFTSSDQSYADYYTTYYWDNYGLSDFYQNNGISKESYSLVWKNNVKNNALFLYYYDAPDETTGKGGVFEVPGSDLIPVLSENYILANQLAIPTESSETDENGSTIDLTDDEIAAIASRLEGYARRINNGTSFDTVKAEYDAETGDENTSSEAASNVVSDTSADSETPASIYPKSATAYSSEDSDTAAYEKLKGFKSAENFAYGKAIVTDDRDNGNYYLTVIYDISLDEYYLDYYHTQLLYLLKQDEFDNLIKSDGDKYAVEENKSLMSYYSPNKIKS